MIRTIKVEEIDYVGFTGNTKYFQSLRKAKRYFKTLVNQNMDESVESLKDVY